MIEFTLDSGARSPLYRQIQDQIRYAISVGELVPGDALPSIRELETKLGVNRNTVRRAYLELQIGGTLHVRQGRAAVVAERVPVGLEIDPSNLGRAAEPLVAEVLQRGEAIGLDSLYLAERVAEAARRQDERYPRCAFLECSRRQAEYFALRAERRLGRRVLAIDLYDIRDGDLVVPPSVRFILTTHWHVAEARTLFRSDEQAVFAVGVQITVECGRQLRALGDATVGLVVRDSESLPGFRERLRSHLGRAAVDAVMADEREAVAALLNRVEHVVYTSPCDELVRALAPPRVGLHEIVFEPVPEDLQAIVVLGSPWREFNRRRPRRERAASD